jgi:hypothetical protein
MASVGLVINELEWDEHNEEHCAEHHLTPTIAEEVRTRLPLFFPNKPDRTATHLMIGPDAAGNFWTIAILDTNIEGRWRPITGWQSDPPDRLLYDRSIGKKPKRARRGK